MEKGPVMNTGPDKVGRVRKRLGEAFHLLGDLAKVVWSRIGLSLDAAFANMAAG